MTSISFKTDIELATFRKKELAQNCLVTALAVTTMTLLAATYAGILGDGPLALSFKRMGIDFTKLTTFQKVIVCSVMVVGLIALKMLIASTFTDYLLLRELSDEERCFLLKEMKAGEKWKSDKDNGHSLFAFKESVEAVDVVEDESQLNPSNIKNRFDRSRCKTIHLTDLRFRRDGTDFFFYPIFTFTLLLLTVSVLAKYKFSRQLNMTPQQARIRIIVYGVIAGISSMAFVIHKNSKQLSEVKLVQLKTL